MVNKISCFLTSYLLLFTITIFIKFLGCKLYFNIKKITPLLRPKTYKYHTEVLLNVLNNAGLLPEVEDASIVVSKALVTGHNLIEEAAVEGQVCHSSQQPAVTL